MTGEYLSTYFISASGDRYYVTVSAEGYTGEVTEVVGTEEPLTFSTEPIKWVVDRVQSTRATLSIFLRDRYFLNALYLTAGVNNVIMQVQRNGVLVWAGFLDQEAVEIPRNEKTGYVAELHFGDFKPLRLERYTPEGLISVKQALQRTVARLGVAVKTDFSHLATTPNDLYIDTSLLGEYPSLYDLLDLICNVTVSTVRQWGVVSFRSPLQLLKKETPHSITRWYGNTYVSIGQMYSTIEYRLNAPKTAKKSGEVMGLDVSGQLLKVDNVEKGYYKIGYPRDTQHTYNLHTKEAFGFMAKDSNDYAYSTILRKAGSVSFGNIDSMTINMSKIKILDNVGRPFLTLESKNLSSVGGDIHINAKVGVFGGGLDFSQPDGLKIGHDNTFFAIPTKVAIISPTGNVLYTYSYRKGRWEYGDDEYCLLKWRGVGMTKDGEFNLTNDDDKRATGLRLPPPEFLQSGCKLSVTLYDGYKVLVRDRIDATHYVAIIHASWATICAANPKCQLHQLLYGVEIGQDIKQGAEEMGLEVKAFLDASITESVEYESIAGTHQNTPAWIFVKRTAELPVGTSRVIRGNIVTEKYERLETISDTPHEHLVFKNIYPIYGERGTTAHLTIKHAPDHDVYIFEDNTYLLTGCEFFARSGKMDLSLQRIKADNYVGKKL